MSPGRWVCKILVSICLHPIHEPWHVGFQEYLFPFDIYKLSQGAVMYQAQAALLIATLALSICLDAAPPVLCQHPKHAVI
jgi:hypothetical protein